MAAIAPIALNLSSSGAIAQRPTTLPRASAPAPRIPTRLGLPPVQRSQQADLV
jgi:hypothetical protein